MDSKLSQTTRVGVARSSVGDGVDGIALMDGEVVADQGVAHFAQRPFQSAAVLKGDEDGALEAMRAREPARGVGGQRGLALPAVAVQHDDRFLGQRALQVQQFARASVEAVARFVGEAAARGIGGNPPLASSRPCAAPSVGDGGWREGARTARDQSIADTARAGTNRAVGSLLLCRCDTT